jgi:hypothetical protein
MRQMRALCIMQHKMHNQGRAHIDVSQLTWAYWKGDEWVPVESVINENGYLNARTDHFSTWTITETTHIEEPISEPEPDTRARSLLFISNYY